MPIVLHKNIDSKTQLVVWEMNESVSKLLSFGIRVNDDIKSEKRVKEWICIRLILQKIAPNCTLYYDRYGAPLLTNGNAVSISHSKNFCTVLISDQQAAVDIEEINDKAYKTKGKYASAEEEKMITKSEVATLIWSAKECLYKIHKKGMLTFKTDLAIKKIKKSTLFTSLKGMPYTLHFEKIDNYYIVYYHD